MGEAPRPHGEYQTLPPVSLIIPSRNRAAILIETVASILDGDEIPAELIIIDQSEEQNRALAQLTAPGCRVRYIHSPARGSSRARNDGIAAASHQVLVFTDDDVRVAPDWLGTLVRALERAGSRSVVTGQVFPADTRVGGFVPSTKVDPNPTVYEGRVGEDILYPHNMALYRNLFDEVGTFDLRLGGGARFAAAEYNDFCYRLLEAGCRILYVPEAAVHHRAWRSHADYLPLRWSYGRGQGGYYAKHMSLRDRHMLHRFTWELRHRSGRMLRRLIREPRSAAGEAIYLAGLITGLAEWLVTQRTSA
jgi:GT2 family glycosyltransferase